ncbi:unnamed protein product [Linum tenue]|uniref:AAA+ ATPase domain-containing protein n=1 Tax=Linum tenue TaxID=586396 RepID=A0AAV0N5K2_9ROSI|nr:unnamed protein product [Linum tenue]
MRSMIATIKFVVSLLQQFFRYQLQGTVERYCQRALYMVYPYVTITFNELKANRLSRPELYSAIESYLSSHSSTQAKRLKGELLNNNLSKVVLSADEHEEITDEFQGVKLWWVSGKTIANTVTLSAQNDEKRYYTLTFHKKHRDLVVGPYLSYIMKEGKAIKVRNRQRKLFTNNGPQWRYVMLEHPATFENLALEADKKKEILEDLITFSQAGEYYARIGRAWKRGYLLYGPPGTGKSTMIAAIANLLSYDIFDLELTSVKDNAELRKLLIETTSKSVVVIEDIDCSLDLTGQRRQQAEVAKQKPTREDSEPKLSLVTLSGLLNCIDGLWSACGGERLIIFTTNYVEKLDPALIRKGRMDKHIKLSYCSFEAFKVLAKNYLLLDDHQLFDKIRQLLQQTQITPADVAEHLMPKTHPPNPEVCLNSLVRSLQAAAVNARPKAAAANARPKADAVNVRPESEKELHQETAAVNARPEEAKELHQEKETTYRKLLPYQLRVILEKYCQRALPFVNPYVQIRFSELCSENLMRTELYSDIESYLSYHSSTQAKRLKADLLKNSQSKLALSVDSSEEIADEFQGIKLWWACGKTMSSTGSPSLHNKTRYYRLTFHKQHRDLIIGPYLSHVMKEGKAIKVRNRQRKLYTNNGPFWKHVVFEHPANFETLALEAKQKKEILEDLITFSQAEEYYAKIGRAWKRGYLLYGPPGTGKSTMIAAMANLLNYDIYDLELTSVKDNAELRKLLIETMSKSVIVIEDIDCSLDLTGKRKQTKVKQEVEVPKLPKLTRPKYLTDREPKPSQVTLSGLLNFIDGIWSACKGERLIVFTTNHVKKLDPALIRKGRMDKHIELSYCSFEAFKTLAKNYLMLDDHQLFAKIGLLMKQTKMTPAEIAEHLMPKTLPPDPQVCLNSLMQSLEAAVERARLKVGETINKNTEITAIVEETKEENKGSTGQTGLQIQTALPLAAGEQHDKEPSTKPVVSDD